MTTPTAITNHRETVNPPIEYPAALPSRGLGTKLAASNLKQFGLLVGQRVIGDIRFREVTLPDGWHGVPAIEPRHEGVDPHRWGAVVDQHGRTRATVKWVWSTEEDWHPLTIVYAVCDYTLAAMRDRERLVLDQQWATRAEVLAAAQGELDMAADAARQHDRYARPRRSGTFRGLVYDVHRFARFVEAVKAAPEVTR